MDLAICRRVEDTHQSWTGERSQCDTCDKPVIVENGMTDHVKRCIHCAAITNPDMVLFVELPPDEFGNRSMAKVLKEVFEASNGQWHKDGVWHNQKWILDRQE